MSKQNRGGLASARGRTEPATFWVGGALLAGILVLAALLSLKHFGGHLPGCGPKSGCESLEATIWGKLPIVGWPVSFLGLAYFSALFAGWMSARGRIPGLGLWLVRLGCAGSVLFIAIMVVLRKVCPYCVGIHAGNLMFLVILERSCRNGVLVRRRDAGPAEGSMSASVRLSHVRIVTPMVAAFVLVTGALGVANARYEKKRLTRAEEDRRASSEQIVQQSQQADPQKIVDMWGATGFTGRYRLGPETSPIRIVILTDYQCPDCYRIENELDQVMTARKDVSLSVKHFPMCKEAAPGVPCNRASKDNVHPNACWAARAAETAGILRGNEGFWEMHRWLFSIKGTFDGKVLGAELSKLGYDTNAFWAVMNSPETLKRVQGDVEEGIALGLFYTPMIFVNGVEFKGWQVPGALARTVAEVAAKNPPAMAATVDRPRLADQKFVDDWREQPVRPMPPDTRSWSTGGTAAAGGKPIIRVTMFGDYQEPFCAEMDRAIRDFMKTQPRIRYTFRHYPIDPSSNPALPPKVRPEAVHPLAGRAAKAAEAAGALGDASAYWKMHQWLMDNQKSFSDETLKAAASGMGLDPAALLQEMGKPAVAAAIAEDADAGKRLGLTGVPMIFIDDKWVPRTTREEQNIVITILRQLCSK
jgi:protein-disulfide isomerase/uncharacterized membrane protein